MAQIREEMIVLKISTLVKDDAEITDTLFTSEIVDTVEAVVSELAGKGSVVEVIKDV